MHPLFKLEPKCLPNLFNSEILSICVDVSCDECKHDGDNDCCINTDLDIRTTSDLHEIKELIYKKYITEEFKEAYPEYLI